MPKPPPPKGAVGGALAPPTLLSQPCPPPWLPALQLHCPRPVGSARGSERGLPHTPATGCPCVGTAGKATATEAGAGRQAAQKALLEQTKTASLGAGGLGKLLAGGRAWAGLYSSRAACGLHRCDTVHPVRPWPWPWPLCLFFCWERCSSLPYADCVQAPSWPGLAPWTEGVCSV